MNMGTIHSIAISPERGQLKKEVFQAMVIEDYGIENDAHAGNWGRQITCLNLERVRETNKKYDLKAGPGDFAENILIDGMDFSDLCVGEKLKLGASVILEITQIGKEDHPSIVSETFGVSLLPGEGLFCKALTSGMIYCCDTVEKL